MIKNEVIELGCDDTPIVIKSESYNGHRWKTETYLQESDGRIYFPLAYFNKNKEDEIIDFDFDYHCGSQFDTDSDYVSEFDSDYDDD